MTDQEKQTTTQPEGQETETEDPRNPAEAGAEVSAETGENQPEPEENQAPEAQEPAEAGITDEPAEPEEPEKKAETVKSEKQADAGQSEEKAETRLKKEPAKAGDKEEPAEPGGKEEPAKAGDKEKPAEPGEPEQPAEAAEEAPAADDTAGGPEIEDEDYWRRQDEGLEYSQEEYDAMLQMYESTLSNIEEGQVIKGKIIRITDSNVVLDIGFKSEGTVLLEEFKTTEDLKENDEIEVFLERLEDEDGIVVLSKKKADFIRVWDHIRNAHEEDELVEGTLVRRIKGGVVVDLLGVDAFLPGSQIALRRIPNLDELMGQTFKFKIIKINKRRRNIVISRRVILETEREAKKEKLLQELETGQVREGVVKNITDFGAFIDLGGVDGLLHITDMSWGRVSHPSEMVALGEKINVKILDLDFENGRISLGHKQLTPYPWENAAEKYPVGSKVRGKVVSITNYGAFIELEKGIEGLVHISEMSWTRHIRHPSKIVAIGDTVEAMVLSINPEEEKISLGIKQVEADPWLTLNQKYPVGTVIEGRVRNLTSYGAFVEIEEGIDGLVHISDMSWTKRVHHPSEVVKKGEKVKAVILNMDTENKRISLGMKQLIENPWAELAEKYTVGTEVESPIVRLLDKGVVVDLGDDVEGFVPISQMGLKGTVNNPAEVYQIGDKIELRVIENDPDNHRIVLAVQDPAGVKKRAKDKLKEIAEAEKAEAEAAAQEQAAELEAEEKARAEAPAGEKAAEPEAGEEAGEEAQAVEKAAEPEAGEEAGEEAQAVEKAAEPEAGEEA
ncbi:MAG: 30S ribosomal protein S1, partial [Candidatus Glassbacteria bacterium]|nr:30S ribosomal protein S1 [Candidatus Glassbacteria bacterium]